MQSHPTPSSIVTGPETESYHLNTFEDIECVHCYRPHFYGQPIEEVIKNFIDTQDTVDLEINNCPNGLAYSSLNISG